jgi:hypothetical protein
MEGFRKYLREKHSAEELSESGVDDLDTWDFAAEVRRVAGTKERLLEMLKRGQIDGRIPLFRVLLYTPYEPPREVSMRLAGNRFEINILKLTLWGILSLE